MGVSYKEAGRGVVRKKRVVVGWRRGVQRFGRLRQPGNVGVDDGVRVCGSSVYGVDAGVGAALGLPGSPQKRRLFCSKRSRVLGSVGPCCCLLAPGCGRRRSRSGSCNCYTISNCLLSDGSMKGFGDRSNVSIITIFKGLEIV